MTPRGGGDEHKTYGSQEDRKITESVIHGLFSLCRRDGKTARRMSCIDTIQNDALQTRLTIKNRWTTIGKQEENGRDDPENQTAKLLCEQLLKEWRLAEAWLSRVHGTEATRNRMNYAPSCRLRHAGSLRARCDDPRRGS
jgi:hypothetical protein